MSEFVFQKKDSPVWYYRRKYPTAVARLIGKQIFMKSLKTSDRRTASRLARQLSVEFDDICHATTALHMPASNAVPEDRPSNSAYHQTNASAAEILARVPEMVRAAALRVVELQQSNPQSWRDTVDRWKDLYQHMVEGKVVREIQIPAVHAQAVLNGFDLVLRGEPIPSVAADSRAATAVAEQSIQSWTSIRENALRGYSDKVSVQRSKLAQSKLQELEPKTGSEKDISDALVAWCRSKLNALQPRTVKTQLDAMASALRCEIPNLKTPDIKELRGVMQPHVSDRKAMPVKSISAAIAKASKQSRTRVRLDYEGGASQFDAIAFECLAVLGMRPRELVTALPESVIRKSDVLGYEGLFLRVSLGKNKASEREIPLSDGDRECVNVDRLRQMLAWQRENARSAHGAVSSLNTRFKELSGHTQYQMRHSWKDLAVHAEVDYELRERLLGHAVKGVAAVYGSGIPLKQGLDALIAVRQAIFEPQKR